jgi:hypothetical protein
LLYVQAAFHENLSKVLKIEIGEYTHREHGDLINLLFSLRKGGSLKTHDKILKLFGLEVRLTSHSEANLL